VTEGECFAGDARRGRTAGDDGAVPGSDALGGLADREDARERVAFRRETPELKVR
jgi:hypothetical protein